MRISALCNHLRHPLTYTDAQGKPQLFSLEEIGQVTLFVLSSTAAAIFEAVTSQRSLKASCFSIVIITGSSFYLATAIIKASKGNGSSKPGEDLLRQNTDPVTKTLQDSSIRQLGKSRWHVVDRPNSDKQQATNIEVSAIGLQDNSGWAYLESQQQETIIVPITTTVNKEESPRKEQVVDNLQVNQDEIMQISVMGSPNKTEWVYTEAPTILPKSTQNRPVVIAESKKGEAANPYSSEMLFDDKENEQKQDPVLTISVLGSEVKEWGVIPRNASLSYQQLIVSDGHIKVISDMIKTMGDTYLPVLIFKKAALREMSEEIKNVHPLKFLETILNNPEIKKSMLDVKSNSYKLDGFLNGEDGSSGFIETCKQSDALGNFAPYIVDFCHAVNVDSKEVVLYAQRREWEQLISFLVQ